MIEVIEKIEIIFFYSVDNIKLKCAIVGVKDHRTYWFLPKPFSLSNVPTTTVKLKQIIFFRVENHKQS